MENKRDKFSLDIMAIQVFKTYPTRPMCACLYDDIDWDCISVTKEKFETTLIKALHRYVVGSEFVALDYDDVIYRLDGRRKKENLLHVIQTIRYLSAERTACKLKSISILNEVYNYLWERTKRH